MFFFFFAKYVWNKNNLDMGKQEVVKRTAFAEIHKDFWKMT